MNSKLSDIKLKAMALPVKARAELAEHLLSSLDELGGPEIESMWIDQAEKRYQAYLKGDVSARPVSEFLQEAKEMLK